MNICNFREQLEADHSIDLHFEPQSIILTKYKRLSRIRLYPYRVVDMKVMFMYGKDYKRDRDVFTVSASILVQAALLILFMICSAFALLYIRRKYQLPPNDVSSAFLDILILFIGGGSIRMDHKYERWFFGILLFGAFLIVTVFAGDLLDSFVAVKNKKVTTFEQLAEINAPIHIDLNNLGFHVRSIENISR